MNFSSMAGKSFCKFITGHLNKAVFENTACCYVENTCVVPKQITFYSNLFNRKGIKIKVRILSGLLARENVFFHEAKERVIYHSKKLGKRRTFFPKQQQLCIWQAVVKAILLPFLAYSKSVPGTD